VEGVRTVIASDCLEVICLMKDFFIKTYRHGIPYIQDNFWFLLVMQLSVTLFLYSLLIWHKLWDISNATKRTEERIITRYDKKI
jgi:hypothetical protein